MEEQAVIEYAYKFRNRVQKEMQKRDWKNKDLAEAIGVDPDVVTNAFKQFGSRNKPYQTRQKIRKLFDIKDV